MGVVSHPPSMLPASVGGGPGAPPELLMIGTSHKTAGVAFRESLLEAFGADHVLESLDSAREVAVLSTCNRFELYSASSSPDKTGSSFFKLVAAAERLGDQEEAFYQARGVDAVRHLFRVATGLDSVILGEPQILAQVRAAGISSRKEGTAGAILAPLFDRAFRVGTRLRKEFAFESEEASLSDLAVEEARRMSPGKRGALLIGTGKMVRLAARRLRPGSSRVFVVTRRKTPPKGLEDAILVPYSKIRETATKCDVIVSATSAGRSVLGSDDLRGRRRKIVVDLGMPRNVSPEVRNLPNVTLLDLDDLSKLAKARRPPASMKRAESAAAREADYFYDWLVQTRLSSALAEIYSWADAVRKDELGRALGKLNPSSERDRRVVEAMGRRLVSKLLARPTRFARRRHGAMSEKAKLDLLRSVFGADLSDGR